VTRAAVAAMAMAMTVALACHRSDDPPPVARRDAAVALAPADARAELRDAGEVALPPAPPLPGVPPGLPALPDTAAVSAVTADAVALGELLFFDPRLGADGRTACATCHDPAHDYAGRIATTAGGERDRRRTPALANLAWRKAYGWDGRYASLADLLPVHVRGQQGNELADAVTRLADNATYRAHLRRVGGAPVDAAIAALSAFVLTRYDGDAPWDAVERTTTRPAAGSGSDDVAAGYELFRGKAQCAGCHVPPLYTDLDYHRVRAIPPTGSGGADTRDPGRGKVDPSRRGAFATPTLRGAANRLAFFHDGVAHDLDAVVALYQAGSAAGDDLAIDPRATGIQLSPREAQQLVAFLRALSAAPPPVPHPVLP
jgi:cytochrome c peroxidase